MVVSVIILFQRHFHLPTENLDPEGKCFSNHFISEALSHNATLFSEKEGVSVIVLFQRHFHKIPFNYSKWIFVSVIILFKRHFHWICRWYSPRRCVSVIVLFQRHFHQFTDYTGKPDVQVSVIVLFQRHFHEEKGMIQSDPRCFSNRFISEALSQKCTLVEQCDLCLLKLLLLFLVVFQ